jgi:wyosine [tRNA(Phe)-imidazoG37] synthetase (radical SAM superfamily)
MNAHADTATKLYQDHSRRFASNKFVYPVLSRRSGGISLGVNLNPDKVCNFDCIYCQVDRRTDSDMRFVEMERLLSELDESLAYVTSGEIFQSEKFGGTPS